MGCRHRDFRGLPGVALALQVNIRVGDLKWGIPGIRVETARREDACFWQACSFGWKEKIFGKRGVYADKPQRGGYHVGGSFVALKMICLFICLCFCSFYHFSPHFLGVLICLSFLALAKVYPRISPKWYPGEFPTWAGLVKFSLRMGHFHDMSPTKQANGFLDIRPIFVLQVHG